MKIINGIKIYSSTNEGDEYVDDLVQRSIEEENKIIDYRFICPKCESKEVVLRPMYGSISRCKKCNYIWSN